MSNSSAALTDAWELLRVNLYEHLDEVEFLSMKYAPWTEADAEVARRVIPDLVLVIRGVLVLHDNQGGDRCRTCASPWPCRDFRTIHELVKNPESEMVAILERTRAELSTQDTRGS